MERSGGSCERVCTASLISLKICQSAFLSSLLAADSFSSCTTENLHGGPSCAPDLCGSKRAQNFFKVTRLKKPVCHGASCDILCSRLHWFTHSLKSSLKNPSGHFQGLRTPETTPGGVGVWPWFCSSLNDCTDIYRVFYSAPFLLAFSRHIN